MAGNDAYTMLLLHCDGADTSTTFTDVSIGGDTHSMTAVGNGQVDTAVKEFGTGSLLMDGTGDGLTTGDSTDWDFGTGEFCCDMRVNFHLNTDARHCFEFGRYGNETGIQVLLDSQVLTVYFGATTIYTNAWIPTVDTWYHLAITREGTNLRIFIDGTQLGSTVENSTDIAGGTEGLNLGGNTAGTYSFNGWFDEIRFSKGAVRWSSNFTPPIAAYSEDAVSRRIFSIT